MRGDFSVRVRVKSVSNKLVSTEFTWRVFVALSGAWGGVEWGISEKIKMEYLRLKTVMFYIDLSFYVSPSCPSSPTSSPSPSSSPSP